MKSNYAFSKLSSLQSSVALFVITVLYLSILVICIRHNLLFEIGVSIIFPAIILVLRLAKKFTARVKQLFFIESFYNVISVACIGFILFHFEKGNYLLSYAFALFFVFQFAGFLLYQLRNRKYTSVILSFILLAFILTWFYKLHGSGSIVDADGRFLMWGTDAPLAVKIIYTIWTLQPMLVDSRALPKLTQTIVQLASVCVCWFSGDFFHIRLFTACHLFLLDGILGYSYLEFGGTNFCVIPVKYQSVFFEKVQPAVSYLSVVAISIVALGSIFGGLDLK